MFDWRQTRNDFLYNTEGVYCLLLPPFQIIVHLTFLTMSLTTRFIQKIYANIVKFKSFLKILY